MFRGLNRRAVGVAAIAAACTSGIASAQGTSFIQSREAWKACVVSASLKLITLDDDADTIAEGGFGSCLKEQEPVRATIGRLAQAANPETAISSISAMMAEERQDVKAAAVAAVLAKRRGR